MFEQYREAMKRFEITEITRTVNSYVYRVPDDWDDEKCLAFHLEGNTKLCEENGVDPDLYDEECEDYEIEDTEELSCKKEFMISPYKTVDEKAKEIIEFLRTHRVDSKTGEVVENKDGFYSVGMWI